MQDFTAGCASFQNQGKWWPVIDLSLLNKHLTVPALKMEMAEVIRSTIFEGEWVVSKDLTGAYFYIPIQKKSLNVHVAGQWYQFLALPFTYTST